MVCVSIPYTRVPHSNRLFLDYLYHFDRVADFYSGWPFDRASYHKQATAVELSRPHRDLLARILTRQNESFGISKATLANIVRLRESDALAVVTGQQVGLFSGPAFTVYKALTAIRLCQHLAEEGYNVVPVFWLATEDHDLAEVAQTAIFNEDYELITVGDSGNCVAPRSPVGTVKLTTEVDKALEQLETTLAPGEPRDRLLTDLHACYQPGVPWGRAFGGWMARLFGRWGVVLVDPLDEEIHQLAKHVYQQALAKTSHFRELLHERSRALVQAGYHAQVHVGEESVLLFVTRDGSRLALHESGGRLFLDGTEEVARAQLESAMEARPLDFSPNVLLRPVVQDFLFPTVAYVAGPSELAYLAQAEALYSALGRPMPVIFPRAGFTLIDSRIHRTLEKYRLGLEDVWQGEESLGRKIAATSLAEGWSERFDASEQELRKLLDRLRADIEALDPTLLETLRHAEEKMTYQLEKLRGKLSRAALQRSDLLRRHAQTLLRCLFPEKDLQERQVSGVSFLGRAGYDLLDRLLACISLESSDHQMVTW
jgi:bacillithiol biosynthesis cysteine-adding enzyme BshC